MGHPAKGDPEVPTRPAGHLEHRGHRDQREAIGSTVAQLAVAERRTSGVGRPTAVMRSPRASTVSRSGAPGSRCRSTNGTERSREGLSTCTEASKAASATVMSEDGDAVLGSARIAWCPVEPPIAEQPETGCRLLHGVVRSWKCTQRVRCRGLPAEVARLRS